MSWCVLQSLDLNSNLPLTVRKRFCRNADNQNFRFFLKTLLFSLQTGYDAKNLYLYLFCDLQALTPQINKWHGFSLKLNQHDPQIICFKRSNKRNKLCWQRCQPWGVLGISSDGDDRMEPKVKTQKNPYLGLPAKPQKIPGPKINPQKISCRFCGP